jgi:hypothetical protein
MTSSPNRSPPTTYSGRTKSRCDRQHNPRGDVTGSTTQEEMLSVAPIHSARSWPRSLIQALGIALFLALCGDVSITDEAKGLAEELAL